MNFGTKEVESAPSSGVGQFIRPGKQELIITDMTTKESSKGSKSVIFSVETPPVEDENFEPHEDAKNGGKIGTVSTIFLASEKTQEMFNRTMAQLGDALGVRKKLDNISAEDIEEYVTKVKKIVKGKKAWFLISGEEYEKDSEGNVGLALKLKAYFAVAKNESDLQDLDKSNPFHYQAVESKGSPQKEDTKKQEEGSGDDMPF